MKQFYVKIEQGSDRKFIIQYWYNTDMRDYEFCDDIPVVKIYNWIKQ